MEYIQKIEKKLKEKGITGKKMLLDLGYSDSLMSKWKKGVEPSAFKLQQIANYLETSVDCLLMDKENTKGENDKVENKILRFAAIPIYDKLKALRKERQLHAEKVADIVGITFYDETYERSEIYSKSAEGFFYKNLTKLQQFYKEPLLYINVAYKQHPDEYIRDGEYFPTDMSIEIRTSREEKGLTQKQLADSLDLEEISIISWESAERCPSWELICLLNAKLRFSDALMRKYEPKTIDETHEISATKEAQ